MPPAWILLADVILNPVFPADELEREKEIQIAGIRSRKDELLKSASLAMRRALFGDAGYGLDSLGIGGIGRESFRRRPEIISPKIDRAEQLRAGDFRRRESRRRSKLRWKKRLANWKTGRKIEHPTSNIQHPTSNRVTETRDKKQAVLVIGFPGTTMADDDRYALDLLQECCSDLGSRLFLRIREQLGLAYYVGAQNFAGLVPGYFAFYTGTEPAKAAQVEKELLKEAELLRTEGLTAEELKRAKAKIIGQKKIARADLGNLASTSALGRALRPRLAARRLGRRQIRSRDAGTNQGHRAKISEARSFSRRGGEAGNSGVVDLYFRAAEF